MAHLLRDRGHGEDFLVIQRGEKKKLRERNIARRQLFAEMQNKTALHFEDDVGETLSIGTELVDSVQRQLGWGLQRA